MTIEKEFHLKEPRIKKRKEIKKPQHRDNEAVLFLSGGPDGTFIMVVNT